jgi:hypothetical protein
VDWEAGRWNSETQLPPVTVYVQFVLLYHLLMNFKGTMTLVTFASLCVGPTWPDGDYTQPVSWYDASITPLEQ